MFAYDGRPEGPRSAQGASKLKGFSQGFLGCRGLRSGFKVEGSEFGFRVNGLGLNKRLGGWDKSLGSRA